MKAYPSLTPDYILHKMSFANAILYSSVIPSLTTDKKEKVGDDEPIDLLEKKREGLSIKHLFGAVKQMKNGK